MNERELTSKIEEIQLEHFSRMNRDLAPYLEQLRALQGARTPSPSTYYPNHYQPQGSLGNYGPSSDNMRAMTEAEKKEYYERQHMRGNPFLAWFGF